MRTVLFVCLVAAALWSVPALSVPGCSMVHATASSHINAPAERVYGLYADPRNWPAIFPLIRSVRIVQESGAGQRVEVDHRREGAVTNIVHRVSGARIDLEEWKSRYDAVFQNVFEPEGEGTRYTVNAEIRLKGLYRLAAPFVKPIVQSQMRRYVLAPMKTAAEKQLIRQPAQEKRIR